MVSISLLERGGQAGDPAGVALEGAAEYELLSHRVGVGVGVVGGGGGR